MTVDRKRAEAAIAEFLAALGLEDQGLEETPARVTEAYADELLAGYGIDVERVIVEGSEAIESDHDPVIVDRIAVATVCPHHLLVARGEASVGYRPRKRLLGLGTVVRVVRALSARLVLQEEIARDVCKALMDHAGASSAFCRFQMNHACLSCRGAREPQARVVTWAARGDLSERDWANALTKGALLGDLDGTISEERT